MRDKGTIKRIQNKIKQKKTRCYFETLKHCFRCVLPSAKR